MSERAGQTWDVLVIGAGAAGMMAAFAAGKAGKRVLLLEKNEKAGKKIFITGKGRCNVTNACEVEDLFQNVISNPKFLYSAFYTFDNQAVMDFFENAGCHLKIERGERVFPTSDHSSDVIAALLRELKKLKVEITYHSEVVKLLISEGAVTGVKLRNGEELRAKRVIVTTGGLSYASTGSTGDGFKFASEAGLAVTKLVPSLVPLNTEEKWCADLMGLSLKNVELRLFDERKEYYRGFGEMLFTHFGVSGPLVLTASCYYAKYLNGRPARMIVDLKPALSEEQLDKRILRDFEENKNKQFGNALGGLFPAKLIPVMVKLSGISTEKKVHEITKEERRQFVSLIKNLPLTVSGARSFAEAIVTQGGVAVKEINPSTMESKKIRGLYFAGEVLDLDAVTGGFNLQIAWSTGYLAGCSAAENERNEES